MRFIYWLVFLATILAARATSGQQQTQPSPNVQHPDCSDRTACLCPWRDLLSLDDFAPVDQARVPARILSYPDQDKCAWRVVQTDQGLRVFHTRPDYRRDFDVLPLKQADANRPWNERGSRLVVAVEDGYIVARNSGEWGAGVWWLSKDRRASKHLSEDHVTDLIKTPNGVVATVQQSGPHYGEEKGAVLLFERTTIRSWRVKNLAETDRPALCVVLDTDGTLLIATGNQLLRLMTAGALRLLHAGQWSAGLEVHDGIDYTASFSPNSIVALPHGEILVGMHAAVVRLTPGPIGYKETWLTPRRSP